ncbi:hypothetical protein TGCAST_309840 [Toxoplasma gondii CAST]|uniref:Uncharacterized protein n=1 Tax=Toxoplasma gondii CAST TaxID=943122 RepID=A0A3R8AR70_TOXGO|nr:hypothetical protein TGCAST_309840 [Toxoplasma gondii CAST]
MGGCASSVKRKCQFRTHRNNSCKSISNSAPPDGDRAAGCVSVAAEDAMKPNNGNPASRAAAEAVIPQLPRWGDKVHTAEDVSLEFLPACLVSAEHELLTVSLPDAERQDQMTNNAPLKDHVASSEFPVHNMPDVTCEPRVLLWNEEFGKHVPFAVQRKPSYSELVTAEHSRVTEGCSISCYLSNQTSEQLLRRRSQKSEELEGMRQLLREESAIMPAKDHLMTAKHNAQAGRPVVAVCESRALATSSLALSEKAYHDRPMIETEKNEEQFQVQPSVAATAQAHDLLSCGAPCHLQREKTERPEVEKNDATLEIWHEREDHPLENLVYQPKEDSTACGTSPLGAPSSKADTPTVTQRICSLADGLHIQVIFSNETTPQNQIWN